MILITGATGIIGSHILTKLLQSEQRIRLFVRESSDRSIITAAIARSGKQNAHVEYAVGSISDPLSIEAAIEGCNEVYHCAAMVSFNPADETKQFEVNVGGTANIVNACLVAEVEKLCYISSTAAIGDVPIDGKFSEGSEWTSNKGRSGYSLSKRYAEMEALRGREEGLSVLIVNPAIVIGSGNWGESSTTLITSCETGMRFYPTGSNGFVDALDVARFCVEGMQKKWFEGRYLLVGENMSFKALFTLVTAAFGSSSPKIQIPKRLAKITKKILKGLEIVRLNFSGMSSHNIDSAYRCVNFSNERALRMEFKFDSISNAVERTVREYKTHRD